VSSSADENKPTDPFGSGSETPEKRKGHKMNSYVNLMLETEGVKDRLQRLFQSTPEVKENDQALPLAVVRKERHRRSVRSRALSPFEGSGYCAVRIRSAAQRGAVNVEASIWITSYLLAILGLVKAAYSEQPLFWLAVWPAPIALVCTIFIFFRQGFRFQNGVLILGRRRV
jgi:hypothetical protein